MIAAAALASLEGSGWSSTITRNSIFGHFRYLKSAKSWIVCKLNKAFFHFFSFAIFLTYCICLGRDFLFRILHSLYYNPDNHQISYQYQIFSKKWKKSWNSTCINSHFFTAQCQNPGFSDLHTIHGLPCMYINFDGALSR